MSNRQEEFQKFLDQQRLEYRRCLPLKIADIESLWRDVKSGEDVAGQLAALERLAHTLAGTAGTFGFMEVSLAAKHLEEVLQNALKTAQPVLPDHGAAIDLALVRLQNSVQALL